MTIETDKSVTELIAVLVAGTSPSVSFTSVGFTDENIYKGSIKQTSKAIYLFVHINLF